MSRDEKERIAICRRLLHMVRELHAMGYEQLRIEPAVAPSGLFWRLSVFPASNSDPENGARMRDYDEGAHYSSGGEDRYFDWDDATDDSSRELAEKFVERFPELAKAGKGGDAEYVRWYEDMLQMTEPDGLPYAYADWPSPEDSLGIFVGSMDIEIQLPPGFGLTEDRS
jgi:hypothetical protein